MERTHYKRHSRLGQRAQALIEFTFVSIVLVLIVFGLAMLLRWVVLDFAGRRYDHDNMLTRGGSPENELDPNFSRPRHMETVYQGLNLQNVK